MANSENKISLGRYPINRKDNFWSARVAGAAMAVVGGLVGCQGVASTPPETPHSSPSPTPSISQETPVKPDFPWKGSSSVEITKVSQGIGGGEIQPVGTLTPEDQPVVEAIKAAAKDGRILTMEGKVYVVSKPLTGEIVCFHNNRTGKDWQVVRAEGVDGFFLPTDYLVPDGTEEKVLVFIPNPSPGHPISLLANWGVVLAEGDNPQAWIYPEGRIPKMIVGINPDFKPEPFPATFEIRPVQAGEKIELSRYLESSKNNQVSYVKESWNVDQSDFPQDLTVVGMASDGWIKVMGTEKTGQKTTFWLQLTKEKLFEPGKPSGPIMVLGNWLAVPEIDLPSEFQKLLEAEKGPDISKSPRIEGLKATLENGQIVYRAEAGNQYGLKEGEWAGEFKGNVLVGEKKTGGIVLKAKVVRELQMRALEKGPVSIPIPIDIREAQDPITITYDPNGFKELGLNMGLMRIFYKGELPITSIFEGPIINMGSGPFGNAYVDGWSNVSPRFQKIIEGEEMRYIVIMGKNIGLNNSLRGKNVYFGDQLGINRGPIEVQVQSVQNWINVTPENTLFYAGVPVFVAANSPAVGE